MTITNKKIHRHLDGEISFGYSSYFDHSNKEEWFLPEGISGDGVALIADLSIKQSTDDIQIKKVIDWISEHYGIISNGIVVDRLISFVADTIPTSYDNIVMYNQEAIVGLTGNLLFDYIIKDPEQLATYIIQDNILVSYAFDNKNGNHSVETHPNYRRRGYAQKCLERLIVEYDKLGKRLYHNTIQSNIPSIQLAQKCGMTKHSEGYWIRISPEEGKLFYENNTVLFE